MNTVLHVPLNKDLKTKAEYLAKKKGYSSLQEVLRVFIVQFTSGDVKPAFINTETIVKLTPQEETHLAQRTKELQQAIKSGSAYTAHTPDEMMKVLEENGNQ